MDFLQIVTWPFAWVLRTLYFLFNNYGLALIAFTLIIKLILTPFQMKSRKSMMKTSRLSPKMKALEAKYPDDKNKYQMEVQKLYKEEGVKPMSGCLWTLIPLAIMLLLYQIIRYPLTNMFQMPQETYDALKAAMDGLGFVYTGNEYYSQIAVASSLGKYWDQVSGIVAGVLSEPVNFNFLGINIGEKPMFLFWKSPEWGTNNWNVIGLWLIPIIAGASQFLASWISQKQNEKVSTDDKGNVTTGPMQNMKGMLYTMPIMSIWFAFIMPAGIGIYWIANAIFGIIQDTIIANHYRKFYDREDEIKRQKAAEEAAIEAARQAERERREAEGIRELNPNTSKKKIAAQQKASGSKVNQKPLDKMSARELAEYWAKVAEDEEKGKSKPSAGAGVGNRPFARGRNYNPNRFGASAAPAPTENRPDDKDAPAASKPEDAAEPDEEDVEETVEETEEDNE